jgi:hypothetical protein
MKHKLILSVTAALLMCAGCADFGGGGGVADPEDGVNAYLTMLNPVLRIQISPGNGGKISASPTPNSYGTYRYGDVVTIIAVPNNGFVFNEWSGAVNTPADTLRIVMDGNKTLTAGFKPKYTIIP